MKPSSFNRVTVDSAALAHNYRLIGEKVGAHVRVMAMVKSDGYGHGLVNAARAFADAGCTAFGVAEIGEGVELRESGCEAEIFTFIGFVHDHAHYFFSHRLTPVIFNSADLEVISREAVRRNTTMGLYVKFDCGMGRLGFAPEDAETVSAQAARLQGIEIIGIMSHFPCADDRYSNNTRAVNARFEGVAATMTPTGGLTASIGNSGGVLYFPETHADLVRVGISLYGYYPDGAAGRMVGSEDMLQPAMQVATRVVQVRDVKAGSGISYGHIYHAERDMRVAVLPLGYSNGYPRSLSNLAQVLIRGQRAPIRGRICMNLCMADVSEIAGVETGDEVMVLGTQGEHSIDADEIAGWGETISYEILCSLGNNNPDRRGV